MLPIKGLSKFGSYIFKGTKSHEQLSDITDVEFKIANFQYTDKNKLFDHDDKYEEFLTAINQKKFWYAPFRGSKKGALATNLRKTEEAKKKEGRDTNEGSLKMNKKDKPIFHMGRVGKSEKKQIESIQERTQYDVTIEEFFVHDTLKLDNLDNKQKKKLDILALLDVIKKISKLLVLNLDNFFNLCNWPNYTKLDDIPDIKDIEKHFMAEFSYLYFYDVFKLKSKFPMRKSGKAVWNFTKHLTDALTLGTLNALTGFNEIDWDHWIKDPGFMFCNNFPSSFRIKGTP